MTKSALEIGGPRPAWAGPPGGAGSICNTPPKTPRRGPLLEGGRAMYQQRELIVLMAAAGGTGFLVGSSMQETEPVAATSGITIVRRLELPPRLNDGWGGAWPLVAPLKAELIPVVQTDWA